MRTITSERFSTVKQSDMLVLIALGFLRLAARSDHRKHLLSFGLQKTRKLLFAHAVEDANSACRLSSFERCRTTFRLVLPLSKHSALLRRTKSRNPRAILGARAEVSLKEGFSQRRDFAEGRSLIRRRFPFRVEREL